MPVVSGNLVFAGDVVSLLGNSVQKGYSNEVTSGSGAVTFNAAASGSVAVAPLSTTKFVIAYSDGGNASDGTAIVGTVSGGTIAFSGADLAFNAAATDQIAIAALGTSKFVVVYRNIANTKGTAIVGTVSGSTITFGTAVEFSTGAVASPSVTNLDNTHFVVAYTDIATSSVGVAVVGTVTGSTTLSFGSKFAINSASATGISIASVSATKFVAAFDDGANSNQGVFLVGAVSGTDITTGSKSFFNAGQTFGDSIAALSSTRVVVAFGNGAGHGMACIGTISGSSITAGTAFTFHPANSLRISVAPLATDKFVVAYTDDGNASLNGKANVGTINGTAISYSPDFIVGNLVTNNTAVAGLTPTLFVTAFDNATLNHGEANLCALSGTGQTILGVAASSSSGGSVPVILGGVSNVYSGLTPGATYYANGSGTITTTNPALPRVGLALSASEILLKIE
jgi:hypothetical protein